LLAPFYAKKLKICQDRLGTNIGKVPGFLGKRERDVSAGDD
jgi:hypothetical protein